MYLAQISVMSSFHVSHNMTVGYRCRPDHLYFEAAFQNNHAHISSSHLLEEHELYFLLIDLFGSPLDLLRLFFPTADVEQRALAASGILSRADLPSKPYKIDMDFIPLPRRYGVPYREICFVRRLLGHDPDPVQHAVYMSVHREGIVVAKRKKGNAGSGLIPDTVKFPQLLYEHIPFCPAQRSPVESGEGPTDFTDDLCYRLALLPCNASDFDKTLDVAGCSAGKFREIRITILEIYESPVAVHVVGVLGENSRDEELKRIRKSSLSFGGAEKVAEPDGDSFQPRLRPVFVWVLRLAGICQLTLIYSALKTKVATAD